MHFFTSEVRVCVKDVAVYERGYFGLDFNPNWNNKLILTKLVPVCFTQKEELVDVYSLRVKCLFFDFARQYTKNAVLSC